MSKAQENWLQGVRARGDHREFVGPADEYDVNTATQFNLLTFLGFREFHNLLDIGCGSLRAGRLFIVYLRPGHYFGIEPERWLVESAIREEIGKELIELKSPSFRYSSDFSCNVFDQKFDYVLAQGVFTHAPERLIRECMSKVAACMKLESIFAATYMQGSENHTGSKWVYPDTTTYTSTRMTEVASDEGLSCVPIDWPHPRGARWILLCSRENENNVRNLAGESSNLYLPQRITELQKRLSETQLALARLKRYPYVRIGVRIHCLLRRLGGRN